MTWIDCIVDNDYQIFSEEPFQIRRKSNKKIIKENDINDTEKESNDIDIYKQKVDEIKDYLIRMKNQMEWLCFLVCLVILLMNLEYV